MPASAKTGMRSWYVTQSNGAVLRKSSIRKLPTNMATEKAVTYAKKKNYRMMLFPLNGESIRKCV